MSDSNSMWPFQEISAEEGLDINEIFGTGHIQRHSSTRSQSIPGTPAGRSRTGGSNAPRGAATYISRSVPSGADPCAARRRQ